MNNMDREQELDQLIGKDIAERVGAVEIWKGEDVWTAGSGPEECRVQVHENPQWVANHAINALALALELWKHQAEQAAAEAAAEAKVEEEKLVGLAPVKGTFLFEGREVTVEFPPEISKIIRDGIVGGFSIHGNDYEKEPATPEEGTKKTPAESRFEAARLYEQGVQYPEIAAIVWPHTSTEPEAKPQQPDRERGKPFKDDTGWMRDPLGLPVKPYAWDHVLVQDGNGDPICSCGYYGPSGLSQVRAAHNIAKHIKKESSK